MKFYPDNPNVFYEIEYAHASIICARINKAGTEAAALYLVSEWEPIYKRLQQENDQTFTIIIKIPQNAEERTLKLISHLEPVDDYPRGLFRN